MNTTPNSPVVGACRRVAIVHDWLVTLGGAERVLKEMLACFPDADVFTLVDSLSESDRAWLGMKRKPIVSFIDRLPRAHRSHRPYLPLFPLAVETFELGSYDLVLSSQFCVAHGVITSPTQCHVSYCHSPVRYAWDLMHPYLRESGLGSGIKRLAAMAMLGRLRQWDARAAGSVDHFVANSRFIAGRIRKYYRREAAVVYPPVDVEGFSLQEHKQDYYITVSRLVPYKRVDLVVAAFAALPDKRLIVVGDGPDMGKIKALARPNIEILGFQPTERVRSLVGGARAFVFAAEEDFGIAPVEAQAAGTPVICLGRGGCLETVRSAQHQGPHLAAEGMVHTGVHFPEQTVQAVQAAVHSFEQTDREFVPAAIRRHALNFSAEAFRSGLLSQIAATRTAARSPEV